LPGTTAIASVLHHRSADHPHLVWLLAPFTHLIALSRMVLGLRYPSDVLAKIPIGAFIAGISHYFRDLLQVARRSSGYAATLL
jgi:membrane-associated phospholipid phosphatase